MNRIIHLFRKLRRIPQPVVTSDEALWIALEEMARRGEDLHETRVLSRRDPLCRKL